ncbi:unnamed protein product [Fraxinus pennsylvanica]|uniref:RING-type E3 ubiquitin transferase n=1 Tax=Fraxinus pennsylvanica TaxID=56036 RepID=A0AAD2EEN2_9LAMI|nr:unnamed protein product [Fraxinus pennsylvanica]
MSDNPSEWSKLDEDKNPIESLAESVLAAISAVASIEVEKENFIKIGCFLYRASMVISEFHINKNSPTNVIEILQSLSMSADRAKNFAKKLQKNAHTFQLSEFRNILEQLEGVMRNIGDNLSLVPLSVYEDQDYAEKAAKAISKEMKAAYFVVNQTRVIETKEKLQMLSSVDISREDREQMDTDLYSVDIEIAAMRLQLSGNIESRKSRDKNDYESWSAGSLMSLPQMAQYMEPLYDTFFCPLTKKIMDDPVTIESGVTYERTEILEWFHKFENPEEIVCPKSGQKLNSSNMSTNVALKATIDEWKERNETARIKVARAALSLASTENMVLEAIEDLQSVCNRNSYKKVHLRSVGMIPLLANFLNHKSRGIRCAALELLRELAEDDDEGKEIIAKTVDISRVIKMLSSNHGPIRHASVSLLFVLSRSQFLCDEIGAIAGGILMLITAKYRQSIDAFTSEKADEILKNLEKLPNNIKLMAENGYWEPLLIHLVEGTEEMRMEMANYLGEIVLGPESETNVAEKASPALIQMVHTGNSLSRNAAFKALKKISRYHPNAEILVEAGIIQIMVKEMFTRTIHNEPMNSKTEAAGILANILESGKELVDFQVSEHGHTLASDYIVYNIVHQIVNSTPDELNINLIRILLCLMKFPKASDTIVSVIKETEASFNLIELINFPNEDLGLVSIKLLITLSAFMGHTLSTGLCKTRGQPESLIQNPTEITRITEKDAVSVNFLAKLPHQNLALNLALVNGNIVPTIIKSISQIQITGTRSSRYANAYFEGLVGILVRLTTTLYDHQILLLARTYNFASVLTELLTKSYTDEVHKLSAIGLENLSKQSVNLSKPPQMKKNKILKFFIFRQCSLPKSSKSKEFSLCPIHRGVCSTQETFCLLDAKADERLLAFLDHENVEVVGAALSALCTLLDDKVDVEKSVILLCEKRAIQHVLNIVKEHREEALLQKSFWVIERFLLKGGDKSASDISQDRLLPATLVSAFHRGDECTRQMAEKILRSLNKMPTSYNTFTM